MELCSVQGCEKESRTKGYCKFHYVRWRRNVPFDRPFGLKGENNPNWKGGKSGYKDHWTMKKNRLIKIKQCQGKCEICNKKGLQVHHRDENKQNHSLNNLIFLCIKCHKRLHRGRRNSTTIWIRRYGFNAKELCKKLNCSWGTLQKWHKQGWINFFLGK